MNRSLRLPTAVLMALALCASEAQAESRDPRSDYDRDFSRTLTSRPGQRIEIDHSQGAVRVSTHPGPEVQVTAKISVSSSDAAGVKEFGDGIAISVEETPGAIVVKTKLPEKKWSFRGSGNISFSVDVTVVVPETMPVSVRDRFGDVSVDGLKANATVVNSNGKVTFRDGKGSQKIENSFGPIELLHNVGAVEISGGNGTITVAEIDGPAQVRNRFGDLKVSGIRGKLTLASSNGSVVISDVTGAASITNSFGSVTVRDLKGPLEVENSNGSVSARTVSGGATVRNSFGSIELAGVGGDTVLNGSNAAVTVSDVAGSVQVHGSFGKIELTKIQKGVRVTGENAAVSVTDAGGTMDVKTSFGLVEATRIQGDLIVENANGAVKGSGIKGKASIRTSFASAWLEGVGGSIEVDNANGSIEVRNLGGKAGACQPVSLKTSFAPIRVTLAEGSGWDVDARTSFGKIRSEMPLSVSGDALSGKIGDGKCPLSLTDANGSIEILKAK